MGHGAGSDELEAGQGAHQHPDAGCFMARHVRTAVLDYFAESGQLEHRRADQVAEKTSTNLPETTAWIADGRPRIYRRRMDGMANNHWHFLRVASAGGHACF